MGEDGGKGDGEGGNDVEGIRSCVESFRVLSEDDERGGGLESSRRSASGSSGPLSGINSGV